MDDRALHIARLPHRGPGPSGVAGAAPVRATERHGDGADGEQADAREAEKEEADAGEGPAALALAPLPAPAVLPEVDVVWQALGPDRTGHTLGPTPRVAPARVAATYLRDPGKT
jgi:hypothetical protein